MALNGVFGRLKSWFGPLCVGGAKLGYYIGNCWRTDRSARLLDNAARILASAFAYFSVIRASGNTHNISLVLSRRLMLFVARCGCHMFLSTIWEKWYGLMDMIAADNPFVATAASPLGQFITSRATISLPIFMVMKIEI